MTRRSFLTSALQAVVGAAALPLLKFSPELKSIAVRANNKKLRAQWSIEEMQDLRAYHGLMVPTADLSVLEWANTPFIFEPYADYVKPQFTCPTPPNK